MQELTISEPDTGASQTRPIRVLHHVGCLNRGGVETWLLQVLRKCDRSRVQMDFLVRGQDPGEYSAEIQDLGSRVMNCSSHRNPVAFAINLKRLLQGVPRYDVLHSHIAHYDAISMCLARRLQIPIRISHSHNDERAVNCEASIPWKAYYAAARVLINRFATHRIAASTPAAESLFGEAPSPSNQVRLLRCGIDLDRFAGFCGPDAALRASLGIPSGSFVVGHVGRFEPQKNHHFMIDLARSVVLENPNIHFVFVGWGKLEAECTSRVAAQGLSRHITILGSRPDIPQLMGCAMDLFILPSIHEGLPLVLLEAQAAGLPSLVSDTVTQEAAVVPEAIRFLPLSSGTAGWAHEILTAAHTTPRRSVTSSCPLKGTQFDVEVSSRRLLGLYQAALHEGTRKDDFRTSETEVRA